MTRVTMARNGLFIIFQPLLNLPMFANLVGRQLVAGYGQLNSKILIKLENLTGFNTDAEQLMDENTVNSWAEGHRIDVIVIPKCIFW